MELQSLKVLGFGSFWVPRSRVYVEYMRPRQMPVLRSWRFWGALVALIITWRVTIKAEIRPLLCSAAAARSFGVCSTWQQRLAMAWEYFLKLEKTELTNTWTAISGIKFSFRKPCEKYHPCIKPHNPKKYVFQVKHSKEVKVLKYWNGETIQPLLTLWASLMSSHHTKQCSS